MADAMTMLSGVHHTARPTWKLKETVEFYHGVLGLPIVHAISAAGWGPEDHPDFLHFFFGSGRDSTIAFFYYLGTPAPEEPLPHDHWLYRSVHTAWRVESRDELLAWKAKLEAHGFSVLQVRHEIIESIYVTDPNGYMVEISWQIRPMSAHDGRDAELTIQAAITLEEERGERLTRIEDAWRRKAELVGSATLAKEGPAKERRGVAAVFVLDVPEFRPLADIARTNPAYRVTDAGQGYLRIESDGELTFERKALGFKPAIWYGAFTGGVEGRIVEFSRDHVRLVPDGDADGSGVGSAELASPP